MQKLKRSTFMAAAALSLLATARAHAAELNYTADDLGPSRYIVDLYTATDYGLGQGTWYRGARPVVAPVLTTSLTNASQSGSVNFLNYRNSALVSTAVGVNASISASVYQDGVAINALVGTAGPIVIIGPVFIPNVQVRVEGLGASIASYNLYNPNNYNAVFNVAGSTITSSPGRAAIHADAFVDLALNLSGNSRINGATLATAINVAGATTFNGDVAGTTTLSPWAGVTYTSQANSINGDISGDVVNPSFLSFLGSNTVNGSINLHGASNGSTITIGGAGVAFNGPLVDVNRINFATGGALAVGYGVQVNSNIDFQGNSAALSLGEGSQVNGNIATTGQDSGSLLFNGNGRITGMVGQFGSLRQIDLQGGAATVAYFDGSAQASVVNLNSNGIAAFAAGLDTRLADTTLGSIRFHGSDGEFQLGTVAANPGAASSEVFGNFLTDTNNNGVLTLVGGTQSVTGAVGALGKSLRLLNVGGANSARGNDFSWASTSNATIDGDVYAQAVHLNSGANSSTLTMATGRSLVGTTFVDVDAVGTLRLAGGTQSASFATIGSEGTRLHSLESGIASGDVSTVGGVTYLNYGYTNAGRTDFRNTLDVGLYQLFSGTANFNVIDGATRFNSGLWIYDVGTANFHQGLSGNAEFIGLGGTINVAAGKDWVGGVYSGWNSGTLNFAGGVSLLDGSVSNIDLLSVGSAGAGVGASSQGTLTVTGNISATTISLANGSTLNAQGHVFGNIVTTGNGTGSLSLVSGNQIVGGSVGSAAAHLASATVGATGATTQLNGSATTNGMSYVDQVTFAGNGTLVLNGANGGSAVGGLVGAVDFTAGGQGTLAIGSGVNLTFGAGGLSLQNANEAHLSFLGDSTVTGQIGAPAVGSVLASSTPRDVYAGANGSVVNFGGKVFVSATTFHVVGTGTVNFADDLVGPLVYEANGTVNFADAKGVVGVVTTNSDNQGILNYLGSTTLAGAIGAPGARLQSVTFHTDGAQATASQQLGYDIYAVDTVIGNTGVVSSNPTTTVATLAGNIHLGTHVTLADASTTLYTSGAQTLAGSSVDFVHVKNADGTLSIATVTQATLDANLTTNGATLGFAISASPFTTLAGANGLVNPDASKSSRLTSSVGGLFMSGTEQVRVSLLGSLRDGVAYTLVDVAGGASGAQPGTLRDNSYVIDTTMALVNGDLVLTTHRDAQTYVTKAAAAGTRGEALAVRLGTLAAAGTGYSASLQTVFDKLDLDQWGYGNNATNLARQLELLTPAGDGAAVQAAFGVTAGAIGTVLDGTADVSPKAPQGNDYWFRAFGGRLNRSLDGGYAGFHSDSVGAVVGTDRQFGDVVVGLALGYGSATATSEASRAGDEADIHSTLAGVYFRAPVGKFFVNGMVAAARHATKTDRQTAVGERAQGDYNGNEIGGAVQFGRRFVLENKDLSLTPVLAVDYARYHQSAYSETGAGDIGLNVAARSYSQSAASFTLRFAKDTKLGEDIGSTFGAYLGYKRLLSTPSFGSEVSFIGDASTFEVGGWQETHKGSATGGLSYSYNPRKGVTYTLQYDAETKSGYDQQTVGIRATWSY